MDFEDDDDRFLDEVTRIKRAQRLSKARQTAQEMFSQKKEHEETEKFEVRHYKEEVERLTSLVKLRDASLKEAKYTISKLEQRLGEERDVGKSSLLKAKEREKAAAAAAAAT